MADNAIVCEGVWKSYRIYHQRSHTLKEKVLSRRNLYENFWALRGIDLEVPQGATIGIIGANGSGKSTLLKTLAQILSPNRGRVEVKGRVSPLLELGTGFHPELTGRENVFLAGSVLGQSKRQIQDSYDGIVDFAGIDSFMDTPVKNYSSGMYARLAFAVAVSIDPEILIIDEVLAVGDEEFQGRCHDRMAELRSEGRTIVLVSHSLTTIRSICSSAAWIDEGVVREFGRSADVVSSYMAEVHTDPTDRGDPTPKGPRFGSGEARITSVSINDANGTARSSFRTGDAFVLRTGYRIRREIPEVMCAVAVFRSDTLAQAIGQTTLEVNLSLPISGNGVVEWQIPSLPLLAGHYVVTVALHDRSVVGIFDLLDRQYSFSVYDNPAFGAESGMVHVDSTWTAWPVQEVGEARVEVPLIKEPKAG